MRLSALFLLLLLPEPDASLQKFFCIIFENNGFTNTIQTSAWKSVIDESFLLTNYYGVTHPSQPNYLALLAGSYFECTGDSACNMGYTNLVDLLEEQRLPWGAYFEDYSRNSDGSCLTSNSRNSYTRAHNPFMSFTSITNNQTRCTKIMSDSEFEEAVEQNKLPTISFYVPNNKNNAHDTSLTYSGTFLQNWLDQWYYPYVQTVWADTLLMVTFDEDAREENNRVVALFKHPDLAHGVYTPENQGDIYNHYSVLRFIEEHWNLGSLGRNDTNALNFEKILPFTLTSPAPPPTLPVIDVINENGSNAEMPVTLGGGEVTEEENTNAEGGLRVSKKSVDEGADEYITGGVHHSTEAPSSVSSVLVPTTPPPSSSSSTTPDDREDLSPGASSDITAHVYSPTTSYNLIPVFLAFAATILCLALLIFVLYKCRMEERPAIRPRLSVLPGRGYRTLSCNQKSPALKSLQRSPSLASLPPPRPFFPPEGPENNV